MAYDPNELYTSAVRPLENAPQKKIDITMPPTRGGAPEWAQPSRQDVTSMIGRYPTPPEIPVETRLATPTPFRATAPQPQQPSALSLEAPPTLPQNYLRNEQTGATYGFRSQPSGAVSGEYIPAAEAAPRRQSPAREALGEYSDVLSTFGGGDANSALAADILTRRVLGKAAGIRQERGATERAAASEAGSLERAKIGERAATERATIMRAPTTESTAHAELLRGQLANLQDRSALEEKLADPKLTGPARDRWMRLYEMKYGSKGEKSTVPADIYNKLVSAGMNEEEARQRAGFADGGVVRGFAAGGEIASPVTQTQQVHPAIAQYGQYLTAAAQSGVAPVPFNQYMNLLQSTRSAMQTTPAQFADGGDVSALGRPLQGPGTGRSDSIPALIDGVQPAALSKGEFVFDEATTKYYGTKHLKEMQRKAKEALTGESEGQK